MSKGIISSRTFYCNHLGASESDEHDIPIFSVSHDKGKGLENYVRYRAFPDEDSGMMRTYVVRDIDTDELVAYFSLKAGLISINERDEDEKSGFDTAPGIEVANFAVNSLYTRKYRNTKGIGLLIFTDFILPIIRATAQMVGVRVIYIFALPIERLIQRYAEYGFRLLPDKDEAALHKRLKPTYDESCYFMYMILK